MASKPEILDSKIVAESGLFRIEAIRLRFTNKHETVFERLLGPPAGAVLVMPILDDELILVREYAAGVDRYELGFVKGRVDEGETREQAAIREMQEEIGFGARRVEYLRSCSTSPAYSNFISHLFLAYDLYECALTGDEPEPLEQIRWPLDSLEELLDHPEVNDARVLLAMMLLNSKL